VQSPYGRLAGEDGFMSGVFGSHQAAMYIGSSAGLPHVIGAMQPGTNWGTAPTPTLDGFMSVQFAGPDAILLQSPNHTAAEVWGAWEFLRFTLQPEVTAQFAIDSGYIPVRYSARELPIFAEYLEDFPLARAASIQFENGFFIPRLPESAEIGSTLATQQERILLGLVSVEEGMQYAEDRANEILRR
jgi:multiple sugar transport system substrate-binding protein